MNEELERLRKENDFLKYVLDQIRNNTEDIDSLTRDQMSFKLKIIHNMILSVSVKQK